MKWMQERDALIAQTLAFVQSVTGRRDAPEPPALLAPDVVPPPAPAAEPAPVAVTPAAVAEAPATAPADTVTARPLVPGDFRSELMSRIANFRAHQERFNREREEYFSTTLARVRAAIKDGPPLPPQGPAEPR